MENKQEHQNKYLYTITNLHIFINISKYLQIKDILPLMSVNQSLSKTIQLYLKYLLQSQKLINPQNIINQQNLNQQLEFSNQSKYQQKQQQNLQTLESEFSLENNDDIPYNILYQYFYQREVLYTTLQTAFTHDNYQQMKVYRKKPIQQLQGKIINYFELGNKFTVFLTSEQSLYFCKTSDYLSMGHTNFSIKLNVAQVSVKGQNILYLTTQGIVQIIFYNEDLPISQQNENILHFSLENPVSKMNVHSINAIFLFKDENEEQILQTQRNLIKICQNSNNQNLPEDKEVKKNILVYQIFNSDEVNFYDNNRFIRLIHYPYSENPKQIIAGKEFAYIISHNKEVYQADFYEEKQTYMFPSYQLKRIFEQKNIVQIYTDRSSYYAVERKQIPPISEWDNEKVLNFMESIQLQDYINIAKYENLDGKKLENITKNYMIQTMGLIKEDLQTKLITEIIKHKEALDLEEKIYVWGKNDYQQLGLPVSSNIYTPTHIQIQGIKQGEFIQDIQLTWKNTIIFTTENQIYCSDYSNTKKQKVNKDNTTSNQQSQQLQKEIEEQQQNLNKKQKKNKKQEKFDKSQKNFEQKSENQQQKVQNDPASKWINITDKLTKLQDQRKYKVISLSNSRDNLSLLAFRYSPQLLEKLKKINVLMGLNIESIKNISNQSEKEKLQITQNNYEYNDQDKVYQKKKITKTDDVLKRIKWDEKLNPDEFSIIYNDRFLGDMEVSYHEFDNSEAKVHRIKIFKLNGNVVWDKEKRIDLIQEI